MLLISIWRCFTCCFGSQAEAAWIFPRLLLPTFNAMIPSCTIKNIAALGWILVVLVTSVAAGEFRSSSRLICYLRKGLLGRISECVRSLQLHGRTQLLERDVYMFVYEGFLIITITCEHQPTYSAITLNVNM